MASGGPCHLAHGGVLRGVVVGEFVQVLVHAGRTAAVVTGGGGIEDRSAGESSSVDRVDRDLTASEQVDGIAKLFFGVGNDGERVG